MTEYTKRQVMERMPVFQLSVERINAEKIGEAIRTKISYNTSLNLTKISEDREKGWILYEFRLNVVTTPPAIAFNISGKARIQVSVEEKDFMNKPDKEKVDTVVNMIFPHLMGTLVILSRELQVPPPIPVMPFKKQERKTDFQAI